MSDLAPVYGGVTVKHPGGAPLARKRVPRCYLWGLDVEFAAVPKDSSGGLLSGNYETLFLHQFLDRDGNPISVDGYGGDIYSSAADAAKDISLLSAPSKWKTEMTEKTEETAKTLKIDSAGAPVDPLTYQYDMAYVMDDPGAGGSRSVDGLVLYDDIETGTDSIYAGRLTGLTVEGVTANAAMDGYIDLSAADWSVYLAGSGIAPDSESSLPSILTRSTGRTDWKLVAYDDITDMCENYNVAAVAVCVPGLRTFHTEDTEFRTSHLAVTMEMLHAGRTDVASDDKIMDNGFTVGYVPGGVGEVISVTMPKQTTVEVLYDMNGFLELPDTGGTGTTGYYVTGAAVLCAGAVLLAIRRRKRT